MKLLELMIQNEIVWQVGAEWAAQDMMHNGSENKICFYKEMPYILGSKAFWATSRGILGGYILIKSLASDWNTHAVSRQEYLDAGGWMAHDGGEAPVSFDTPIEARWSDGDVCIYRDGTDGHQWTPSSEATELEITAYRLLNKEPQMKEPQQTQSWQEWCKETAQVMAAAGEGADIEEEEQLFGG